MERDFSKINILLVEDDEVDIMNVKRAFKKNEITNNLFVANNGLEALDLLRGSNGAEQVVPIPQIVLLDINMPKMNGIEFLREIRQDETLRSISVFVMTTSDEDNDKIEAFNLNVAGYIIKPLSYGEFHNKVATLNDFWNLSEHLK